MHIGDRHGIRKKTKCYLKQRIAIFYVPPYPKWYSYVMLDGKKVQLDHLVTNLKYNYMGAEYDWSFMNTLRYKNGIQAESTKKIAGLPDHAILKTEIQLEGIEDV